MPKCLRCGADSEWIEGRVPVMARDEEIARLRAEVEKLRVLVKYAYREGHGDGSMDESPGVGEDWRESQTRASLCGKGTM